MINSSKKNMVSISKQNSKHSKTPNKMKPSQPNPHKKINKKIMERSASEQNVQHRSLYKSKSTKSLKPKTKKVNTKSENGKKNKPKKSLTRTIKKHITNKDIQQMSSIMTDDWQTKKPIIEYFNYHNTIIPIENSAQRRLVYRIQMIDLQNKSTTTTFLEARKENIGTQTDKKQTNEVATGYQIDTSTKMVQTQKNKFIEVPEKCFADLLTQLQFLYLPNDQNFGVFSRNQRIHYGELFQTLAKKMLGSNREVTTEVILSQDQLTVLLYQRQGIQVGALQYIPLEGFPTHLLSILAYLKNLFCYVQYGFKQQILTNLRLFYGLNYNERVKKISNQQPHQKDCKIVLSNQLFQSFEDQMFKDYEFTSQIAKESVHAHNRAIFDSVNEQLQVFRPFYSSQGEPFPWTNNLGMTHYDITEQALYIIFVQVKEKIQKEVLTLCGMHTDFDDETLPSPHKSPYYNMKMQQRQKKMLHQQIKLVDDKVILDYFYTGFMFEIAHEIFQNLISQIENQFQRIAGQNNEGDFQFQYFN